MISTSTVSSRDAAGLMNGSVGRGTAFLAVALTGRALLLRFLVFAITAARSAPLLAFVFVARLAAVLADVPRVRACVRREAAFLRADVLFTRLAIAISHKDQAPNRPRRAPVINF